MRFKHLFHLPAHLKEKETIYDLIYFVIATLFVGMINITEGRGIDYLIPLECPGPFSNYVWQLWSVKIKSNC